MGIYRLWVTGRGSVEVHLDGRPILSAEGDLLRSGADVAMQAGAHRLEVRLLRIGPGPRLRLGWTRPQVSGHPGGRSETIPPRFLGPPLPTLWWRATDLLALVVAALAGALAFGAPWDRPRRLPVPRPVTRSELGWSVAAHAAFVVAMSWPLALDLAGSGVMDRPDARLNAWILSWDIHALLHEPSQLFDAPIFHPLPDTLAFSENLLLPALLAAPATLLGGPVLGYNLALLVSFVVSGLGVQLLVRRVTGDRLAAFVAGAIFAVGPHRWIRLAHLHAQVTLFLPFALLALERFWERRTLRRGLLVGLLLGLQGLSSVYLGAITAAALGVAAAIAVLGGLRGRALLRLAAGMTLAALMLAPLVQPYLRMREFQGMEFTLEDLKVFATTLESYAASGTPFYGPLSQRHLDPSRVRDGLFPGLVPLLLGLVGLAAAPRRYRAVALAASAFAIVFSLGPETAFYRFLHEHVVLVRGIRALSRFSLIPVLALATLTGLALAGRGRLLSGLALALFVTESCHAPLRLVQAPPISETAGWLAGQPGAVAYLPLGRDDTTAMLASAVHFRPLVNGASGFIPRPYDRAMELLEPPLSDDGVRFLRAIGVRHVVSEQALPLPPLARFGAETVHAVPGGGSAAAVIPGTPVAALWREDGILVDLGEPRLLDRVAFQLSNDPWLARPRLAASVDRLAWVDVAATASLADATMSLLRDPVAGHGELRFPPLVARYLLLDEEVPARRGLVWVGSPTPGEAR
jgi:hypothetical protein